MAQQIVQKAKKSENPIGNLPEWNLSDLYPDPESKALKDDLEYCLSGAQKLEKQYSGKLAGFLTESPRELARVIADYERLEECMGKVMSYASLLYASDNTDPGHVRFYGNMQEKLTAAGSHLLFFSLELNGLDEKVLEAAMSRDDALAYYRPWLSDLRKDKPYQLSEQLEQIFHEKSITGQTAWIRLFDETISSLEFDIEGEKLSFEPALNLLQDADRDKRRNAANEISRVLDSRKSTFSLITNTLAKDKEISDRWRGFEDVADSRHLANRVEKDVINALENAVCESFASLSHRYYLMKARWLNLEKMEFWDRNAPLPSEHEEIIEWEEARTIVLEAYHGFAPQMSDIATRFFDGGWIDAPIRKGKSPGAFSHPTVPSAHPYILLNYTGKPRDVMTLAHELGHGVHQVLAAQQGTLMSQTPLTLAETASVFGEMLTFRALLCKCKNDQDRKIMLAQKVEDMLNTVVRQIAFYRFERKIHNARLKGELSADEIGGLWMSVQAESLGPAFVFSDTYRPWWIYIPHFIHSPFYVYAYAFGDCLVNSLYAVYEDAENEFKQNYFELLKAGGAKHYSELLAPFGFKPTDPGFWQKGLSMISSLIDEVEVLDRGAS